MRSDLPSGTVTFLFTDIEGSTRLLAESGVEHYAGFLAEHHRLCREAWEAHGGVEVDTAGDAFFVAFSTASAAVAAAAEAQESLAGGPMQVRMGVHTGTPLVIDGDYVGMDVHRAARIAAAGHGGQVLVSAATAALLDTDRLVDLGEHRFKDLAAPERVFQLGGGDFPGRRLRRDRPYVRRPPYCHRDHSNCGPPLRTRSRRLPRSSHRPLDHAPHRGEDRRREARGATRAERPARRGPPPRRTMIRGSNGFTY